MTLSKAIAFPGFSIQRIEMIIGIGIDLVELERFGKALEKGGERFKRRVFTERELGMVPPGKRETEFLAARFAGKEAVLKSLGTGWAKGIRLRDVEILRDGNKAPVLLLHGKALEKAKVLGASRWHISLTHSENSAAAVAILEG